MYREFRVISAPVLAAGYCGSGTWRRDHGGDQQGVRCIDALRWSEHFMHWLLGRPDDGLEAGDVRITDLLGGGPGSGGGGGPCCGLARRGKAEFPADLDGEKFVGETSSI